MKTIFLWIFGFLCLFQLECRPTVIPPNPIVDFTVSADSLLRPGDTAYYPLSSVTRFTYTSNPYTVTFYSGEIGHRFSYRYRNSAAGVSNFNFTATLNRGNQTGSLHVMLSTDFQGIGMDSIYNIVNSLSTAVNPIKTSANISSATWNDITPANLTSSPNSVTDNIDLSSFASDGQPVYIAFKYTGQAGTIQNQWTISNLTLTNSLTDGSIYSLANLNDYNQAINNYGVNTYSPGWACFPVSNVYNWIYSRGSSLVISGAGTLAASTSYSEAWALMGPIDLNRVTPDLGLAIKSISASPAAFNYIYSAKGSYPATFVATNNSLYSSDSVIRTLPVVVY